MSCPECGGVLRQEHRAGLRQFRCHIGYVLSAETVLVHQMAEDARNGGERANAFEAAAREALVRAEIIKKLLEDEWVQPLSDAN